MSLHQFKMRKIRPLQSLHPSSSLLPLHPFPPSLPSSSQSQPLLLHPSCFIPPSPSYLLHFYFSIPPFPSLLLYPLFSLTSSQSVPPLKSLPFHPSLNIPRPTIHSSIWILPLIPISFLSAPPSSFLLHSSFSILLFSSFFLYSSFSAIFYTNFPFIPSRRPSFFILSCPPPSPPFLLQLFFSIVPFASFFFSTLLLYPFLWILPSTSLLVHTFFYISAFPSLLVHPSFFIQHSPKPKFQKCSYPQNKNF